MCGIRFTVAICTRNRGASLARTLDSLLVASLRLEYPWQLIVVDNGSVDRTVSVLDSFRDRMPLLCVREPRAGLSHARNAALRHISGEYVLWTDDDIVVDAEWMRAYALAVRRWPSAAVFGGPIEPIFEGRPPRWLPAAVRCVPAVFGALDYGHAETPLCADRVPWGGNYVVRMRDHRAHLYDPSLGNRPGSRIGREETDLIRRLLSAGAEGRWIPAARVAHHVPRSHQSLRYLRFHISSRAEFDARFLPASSGRTVLHRPGWLWKAALRHEVRYRWHRLHSPADVWMPHFKAASHAWGLLQACGARSAGSTPR